MHSSAENRSTQLFCAQVRLPPLHFSLGKGEKKEREKKPPQGLLSSEVIAPDMAFPLSPRVNPRQGKKTHVNKKGIGRNEDK